MFLGETPKNTALVGERFDHARSADSVVWHRAGVRLNTPRTRMKNEEPDIVVTAAVDVRGEVAGCDALSHVEWNRSISTKPTKGSVAFSHKQLLRQTQLLMTKLLLHARHSTAVHNKQPAKIIATQNTGHHFHNEPLTTGNSTVVSLDGCVVKNNARAVLSK